MTKVAAELVDDQCRRTRPEPRALDRDLGLFEAVLDLVDDGNLMIGIAAAGRAHQHHAIAFFQLHAGRVQQRRFDSERAGPGENGRHIEGLVQRKLPQGGNRR